MFSKTLIFLAMFSLTCINLSIGSPLATAPLYDLECTIGLPAELCVSEYGTYCDNSGQIQNIDPFSPQVEITGDCTASSGHCACKNRKPDTAAVGVESRDELIGKYHLVCTIGHSAQWCYSTFSTYCSQSGHVMNNAPISKANGDCSSIWRHCYCESDYDPCFTLGSHHLCTKVKGEEDSTSASVDATA